MTDKAYLLQTLAGTQCYDGAAPAEMIFWHPPNLFLKHLAIQYAAENLLPKSFRRSGALFRRGAGAHGHPAQGGDGAVSDKIHGCQAFGARRRVSRGRVKEPLTEEQVATADEIPCRDDEVEPDGPDDADFNKHVDLSGVALEFIRMISERSETWIFGQSRRATLKSESASRGKRGERNREAQERERIVSLPVEELKARDIEQIDDVEKLCRILRSSEDDRAVKAALDRIYRLREDDIEIVRACLPGKCTWALLRFLCEQERETPYRYLTLNHLVREIVPALQREVIPRQRIYWTASTTGNTGVTSTGSVAGA